MVGGLAQRGGAPVERSIQTPVLNIGFEETGSPSGFPIILLHGFPDDVRAWDEVATPLAAAGHRVLVPYLRGYGATRFRDAAAPRMAEQAAIGQDVIDFADALGLDRFAVAGYDWGGRAAAIAAALFPNRVRGVRPRRRLHDPGRLFPAAARRAAGRGRILVSVVLQHRARARSG